MLWLSGVVHKSVAAHPSLGLMLTPNMGNRPELPRHHTWWAADTGCYSRGEDFRLERYLRWLDTTMRPHRWDCLFATAPDVVGGVHTTGAPTSDTSSTALCPAGAARSSMPLCGVGSLASGPRPMQRGKDQGEIASALPTLHLVLSQRKCAEAALPGVSRLDGTFPIADAAAVPRRLPPKTMHSVCRLARELVQQHPHNKCMRVSHPS